MGDGFLIVANIFFNATFVYNTLKIKIICPGSWFLVLGSIYYDRCFITFV